MLRLQAAGSDVVAGSVHAAAFFNVAGVYLVDVPQYVRAGAVRVGADGTHLHEEAGEFVQTFLQAGVGDGGQFFHKNERHRAGEFSAAPVFFEECPKIVICDAEQVAQLAGVHTRVNLVVGHHEVVHGVVVDNQRVVAVVHQSARRVGRHLVDGGGIGAAAEGVVEKLNLSGLAEQDQRARQHDDLDRALSFAKDISHGQNLG